MNNSDLLRNAYGALANRFSSTTIAIRRVIFILLVLVSLSLLLKATFRADGLSENELAAGATTPWRSKTMVVSSMMKDDTHWLEENIGGWEIRRYVTDNPSAKYTVPQNKGREAMVYLTYIIDNYHSLPDLTLFIHGERYQWHNDDPLYDGLYMLTNLQVPFLLQNGYTNIRCVWTLGCPNELRNLDGPPVATDSNEMSASNTQHHYPTAFHTLFPGEQLPSTVGVPCCAQFAATRETIRERSLPDYIRYRDWLLSTELTDHVSGRVLEYSWHIIFRRPAVHCPNAQSCYCSVYGYCELDCGGDGQKVCGERWPFPPAATLPKGWPFVGWKGEAKTKEDLAATRRIQFLNETEPEMLSMTTPGD